MTQVTTTAQAANQAKAFIPTPASTAAETFIPTDRDQAELAVRLLENNPQANNHKTAESQRAGWALWQPAIVVLAKLVQQTKGADFSCEVRALEKHNNAIMGLRKSKPGVQAPVSAKAWNDLFSARGQLMWCCDETYADTARHRAKEEWMVGQGAPE